jgi:magnesium chelatase subunit I
VPRISDLPAVIAAARGKVELLLAEEDAREDPLIEQFTGEAVRLVFIDHTDSASLRGVVEWFRSGGTITVADAHTVEEVLRQAQANGPLVQQAGQLLARMGEEVQPSVLASAVEFLLEGLHRTGKLGKRGERGGQTFAV